MYYSCKVFQIGFQPQPFAFSQRCIIFNVSMEAVIIESGFVRDGSQVEQFAVSLYELLNVFHLMQSDKKAVNFWVISFLEALILAAFLLLGCIKCNVFA